MECYRQLIPGLVDHCLIARPTVVMDYAGRYVQLTWPFLYHDDARCRSEHMERLRRRLERDATTVPASSGLQQRSAVALYVGQGQAFWHRLFEEPAILIVTSAGRLPDVVTGEAPVEYGRQWHNPEASDNKKRKGRVEWTPPPAKVHRPRTASTRIIGKVWRFAQMFREDLVPRTEIPPRAR